MRDKRAKGCSIKFFYPERIIHEITRSHTIDIMAILALKNPGRIRAILQFKSVKYLVEIFGIDDIIS